MFLLGAACDSLIPNLRGASISSSLLPTYIVPFNIPYSFSIVDEAATNSLKFELLIELFVRMPLVMPPLTKAEQDELSARIRQQLSTTRYACSSLTKLNGGSVNFIFRGALEEPVSFRKRDIPMTATTVIIKHSTDFLSVNMDFKLDVSRSVRALSRFLNISRLQYDERLVRGNRAL